MPFIYITLYVNNKTTLKGRGKKINLSNFWISVLLAYLHAVVKASFFSGMKLQFEVFYGYLQINNEIYWWYWEWGFSLLKITSNERGVCQNESCDVGMEAGVSMKSYLGLCL